MTIFLNQHNSPKLAWLDDVAMTNFIIDILKEITIVTGAPIYHNDDKEIESENNRNLIKVIELLFRNSPKVMNLTIAEVRHAIYLNHLGEYVNDGVAKEIFQMYGKIVNADYLGKILDSYIKYKLLPTDKITAINSILNPPVEKDIPIYTIEDYKVWIQMDYEQYLRRENLDFIFNIYNKYKVLRSFNMIRYTSKQRFQEWYEKGYRKYLADLRKRSENKYELKRINDTVELLEAIRKTDSKPPEEHRYPVILSMRQLVYFELFSVLERRGITLVFDESRKREIKVGKNNSKQIYGL